MKTREIVARAREYEKREDAWPAECLLSVLIDVFTAPSGLDPIPPAAVTHAWDKLTRDLSFTDWLVESKALAEGVDVLAANLVEAGRNDLAATLHAIHEPRFEGAARSPDLSPEARYQDDAIAPDDERLWVPRGTRLAIR